MTNDNVPQLSADERFLQFVRTGDKAIIQGLIREFADRSYSQARHIIGRDDGAEDAVQDAYMRLVSTANKYDGSISFSAWLGRIVNLSALDYRRSRRARHDVNLGAMSDQGVAAMDKFNMVSQPVERPELEAIRSALDLLPERYRSPLTLHYFGGLDQAETAQALGVPPETLRTRLARGLEQLRNRLGRAGFAVTGAGLITLFSNLPAYSASPTLVASLTATRRLVAASAAKKISVASGSLFFKAAVVGALAVTAAVTLSMPAKSMPLPYAAMETTPVQSPLGGVPWLIPGTIEAENFDVGGEGVSYHDGLSKNAGNEYRNEGVDIGHDRPSKDGPGEGLYVGWTNIGEWLEYTVYVPKAGNYTLSVRLASRDGGEFHVEFDGVDATGTIAVPALADKWETLTKSVSLTAGQQVMRIVIDGVGPRTEVANLNYFRFTAITADEAK